MIPLLIALLLPSAQAATTGSLCVASTVPRKADPYAAAHGKPPLTEFEANPTFQIQVDDQPAVEITSKQGREFQGLSLSAKHLVQAHIQKKLKKVIHFDFKQSGLKRLCIVYSAADSSWEILDPHKAFKDRCKCQAAEKPESEH